MDVGFMRPLLVWRGYWIDEGYVMSEWIKCSDEYPDEDTLCLAIDSEGIYWTMHYTEDDFYPDTGDICQNAITHWMPLPEPPTD
ncbi:DUF551 domain-containing protein [Serratia marcescens]|uniref:DUF551 domain-containing protein n=1 Tax=Serratia marcescens TaxID=615 RepID=UPI00258149DD|nr:DUF551 domain-containing protein [Serratia marcescens]MDM3533604.1 DUF551 domain-containing protein [Serratia marcescens]MDM3540587.1 DUF551 domain-containing protein [Serratia marcescens]